MCYRENGCVLRTHNHCSYTCKNKHKFGEKCIYQNKCNPEKKLSKDDFINKIYKKYNIQENSLFNDLYYLNNEDKFFLNDTFLSDKAITKEIIWKWIMDFINIFNNRQINVKKPLVILLYLELFSSFRHNFLLENYKFKKTIKEKYIEFVNIPDKNFTNYFEYMFSNDIKKLNI